jgi:hypothetical protein
LQCLCWCVDLLGMKLACSTSLYHLDSLMEGYRLVKAVPEGFTDRHARRCMVPTLASMDLSE